MFLLIVLSLSLESEWQQTSPFSSPFSLSGYISSVSLLSNISSSSIFNSCYLVQFQNTTSETLKQILRFVVSILSNFISFQNYAFIFKYIHNFVFDLFFLWVYIIIRHFLLKLPREKTKLNGHDHFYKFYQLKSKGV